jgi:anthranilate synthase component 1
MLAKTVIQELPFLGDTLALFEKLARQRPDTVLLESKDGNGENDVQSLLFIDNAARIEGRGDLVTVTALTENGRFALDELAPELEKLGRVERTDGVVNVRFPKIEHRGSDTERIKARSTFDALRVVCQGWEITGDEEIPIRTPGIVAYDHLERFEVLPDAVSDKLDFPDFVFWLPERMVLLNHEIYRAFIATHQYGSHALSKGESYRMVKAEDIASVIRKEDGHKSTEPKVVYRPKVELNKASADVDMSDEDYAKLVLRLKEHVVAGDVFQIVASRTFSKPCPDPTRAFKALRRLNPSPYMFMVRASEYTLFGASPEAFVRIVGNPRKVEIHPIAGTRPRGFKANGERDVELDSRLEAELKLNEKELAEHMMLVDLARNDVARVSKPGTRRVASLLEAEFYSHVIHLVSVVEGELREDLDALHAYLASMNMGTLVGAPKVEAARLLRLYELDKRGPYGGAVGYLTSDGEMDTAIVIRSALVKDGVAHIRAGAGIVYDSDPMAEAEETRNKANAVIRAIQISENGHD